MFTKIKKLIRKKESFLSYDEYKEELLNEARLALKSVLKNMPNKVKLNPTEHDLVSYIESFTNGDNEIGYAFVRNCLTMIKRTNGVVFSFAEINDCNNNRFEMIVLLEKPFLFAGNRVIMFNGFEY